MFEVGVLPILSWIFVAIAIGGLISWLMGGRIDTASALSARGLERQDGQHQERTRHACR